MDQQGAATVIKVYSIIFSVMGILDIIAAFFLLLFGSFGMMETVMQFLPVRGMFYAATEVMVLLAFVMIIIAMFKFFTASRSDWFRTCQSPKICHQP